MNLKKLFSFREVELTKDVPRAEVIDAPIGDGGAVFISDATDEEFDEYEHNEKKGWGKFKQIIEILKS